MFASCDDDPDGLIRFLASDRVAGANEIVVIGRQEHSEALRGHIGQAGALFLAKPLDAGFVEEILGDVRAEVRRSHSGAVPDPSGTPLDQCGMLRGSARSMRRLYRLIRKVAPTSASVLVGGESGTGKELVAQTIHMSSEVAAGPLLAVNCGAIPGDLIESELFGHERGSFSGAERTHRGVFERASGGTLFLDEITEMPPGAQVKLLRVLESGVLQRVGGEKDIATSVRIVAATNRDPLEAVESGHLRQDLCYARRSSRCGCRRCASAAVTSWAWRGFSCTNSMSITAPIPRCPKRWRLPSWVTPGRVTCASCAV
ncbi:MAG: sigma-54 factor interaction domain-containing protein [Gammaproteobacteria bacterium]|nr:sigma-54 factor interaction domain-containing protein [Gammaproteobacteria bacterium]